jgi:hypothetical protein
MVRINILKFTEAAVGLATVEEASDVHSEGRCDFFYRLQH